MGLWPGEEAVRDMSNDLEFEMPNLGDDRPGLDDLDEDTVEPLEDEEDDYPEDAGEDDVDLIVALYREDGQAVGLALDYGLANDLEALIQQLRRMPGDGGALGLVSIAAELFVIVRVRGRHVQVFCSDSVAAADWPLARDVVDLLGVEIPDDDADSAPVGDLEILADVGLHDFELEAMAEDLDEDSATLVERIAKRIGFAPQFAAASKAFE